MSALIRVSDISYILLSSICSNTSLSSYCYANRAGVFDKLTSTTYDDTAIRLTINDGTWGPLHFGAVTDNPIYGTAKWALDSIDISGVMVPNVSLNVVDQGYQIYPDGTNYPLELEVLSLGAPSLQQQFANRGQATINGTFFDRYLFTSGGGQAIPSYSYGMHIGTPTYNLAGSLLLGGYDQSRVLGEVSSQPYSDDGGFPIKLRDISLGVVRGGSPWSSSTTNSTTNSNPTGLLAAGNSSITSNEITVYSSPGDSYIYLPQSTCDAIAAHLPVTYQSTHGLYISITSNPAYRSIITSPSYLAFTFAKDNSNRANITIKIPFAVLNLTLTPPLVAQPTPYFPCRGTTTAGAVYALGRAFCRPHFGSGTGNWFLAQAPGPNLQTPSTTVIQPEDTTVLGSDNGWEDSWSGVWTALPVATVAASASASTTNTTTNGRSSCGDCSTETLSTGAKIGIGVVCGVVSIGATVLFTLWYVTRRRRASLDKVGSDGGGEDWPDSMQGPHWAGYELTSTLIDSRPGGGGGWPAGPSRAKPPVELGVYRNEGPHEMG
ncbi:putative aspartic-type endopeptidase [Aspergillus aculeatinus CBS 121060]|uniref:Uncharacterized protein n=1 Tax=Aspergillus aculeatinus CBS 121060 TaxID=1448322 RepID=A0ACD1GS93_9EURO|nr:hypothetical protein BO66DRAFT_444318 [Aspergillus aculeatinus CBS 121060]RAH64153.1 hypothetical protein BO66DRAFT_444318 [Aspergillus aculeatinus CBS 121060]